VLELLQRASIEKAKQNAEELNRLRVQLQGADAVATPSLHSILALHPCSPSLHSILVDSHLACPTTNQS
jgi:hypothetical protein